MGLFRAQYPRVSWMDLQQGQALPGGCLALDVGGKRLFAWNTWTGAPVQRGVELLSC